MKKRPYCSSNGCFMINGAAPVSEIICPNCGTKYNGKNSVVSKFCPNCNFCPMCKRIGKKFF
jgi:hypothetical protein